MVLIGKRVHGILFRNATAMARVDHKSDSVADNLKMDHDIPSVN